MNYKLRVIQSIVLVMTMSFLFSCSQSETSNTEESSSEATTQTMAAPNEAATAAIEAPAGYEEIGQATGDLDGDKVDEKVIVYNTSKEGDFGKEREILIFKNENNTWKLWHKSAGAVLPSDNGGMMGDPFQSIMIEKGVIAIEHFGGSRQKWTYTHRYRFQNEAWKLIGATIIYGSPCDYFEDLDYNLSTGNFVYTKENEECDDKGDNPKPISKDKKEGKLKLAKLPNMDGFEPGGNQLVVDNDITMYY